MPKPGFVSDLLRYSFLFPSYWHETRWPLVPWLAQEETPILHNTDERKAQSNTGMVNCNGLYS